MRTLLALSALALLSAPLAAGDAIVLVRLDLTLGHHALPALKSCTVGVVAGSDGGAVLDAATASGCISGWSHDTYGGGKRFVTCVDGLCQQPGTFWAFYVDEALPCGGACGIDDVQMLGGEAVEFAYVDWFTPFNPVLP